MVPSVADNDAKGSHNNETLAEPFVLENDFKAIFISTIIDVSEFNLPNNWSSICQGITGNCD